MMTRAWIALALVASLVWLAGCLTFDEDAPVTPTVANYDEDDIVITSPAATPRPTTTTAAPTPLPTPIYVFVVVTPTPTEVPE